MTNNTPHPIGILTAMPEELARLRPLLSDIQDSKLGNVPIMRAMMGDVHVAVAQCGIGKVNAAMATSCLILQHDVRGLIFTGCAGGINPARRIGDLVMADYVIQHDYGSVRDQVLTRYQPGMPPFEGLPSDHGWPAQPSLISRAGELLRDLDIPSPAPLDDADTPRRLLTGTVITGDIFINCLTTREALHSTTQAEAVEMEGAALAQVAAQFDVPWVILRAVSDMAGAESEIDFNSFADHAADIAAQATLRLVAGDVFAAA